MEVDVPAAVILGITSAFIGYFVGLAFSLWHNRLRPWITLLEFSESSKNSDQIEITDSMSKTSQTYFLSSFHLPKGEIALGKIVDLHRNAKSDLIDFEKSTPFLEEKVAILRQSKTQSETHDWVIALLKDSFTRDILDIAVICKIIEVPEFDKTLQTKIRFWFNDKEREGCYVIPYKTGSLFFGREMGDDPNRKELLLPMVELISRLDLKGLSKVFEDLLSLMKTNLTNLKLIVTELEHLVNENSRWMAIISITNFGATPFIVFPDSPEISVIGEKVPFRLNCNLFSVEEIENKEGKKEEKILPIKGIYLVKSENTAKLALTTEKTQKGIQDGDILRSYYEKGGKDAFVEVLAQGRSIPRKKRVKSTKLSFSKK